MFRYWFYSFFFLLFTTHILPAISAGTIKGVILDPLGLAVPNANIHLEDTDLGTASKADGSFTLKYVPTGQYKLIISHIRFEPVSKRIHISENQLKILNLQFEKERVIQFDQIAVTATKRVMQQDKIPQPVAQISAQEIKRRYEYNVGAMLDRVPGVRLIRDGGTIGADYGLSIRSLNGGSSSNKTLVLIDGRPINNGWDGGVDFNTIPSEMVERVEIVKGASSALYGSQATAGVINVITRSPQQGVHAWFSVAREFDGAAEITDAKEPGYGRPAVSATNIQMNTSYRNQHTSHLMTLGYRTSDQSFPNLLKNNWENVDLKYSLKHTLNKNLAAYVHIDLHSNNWENPADRIPTVEEYDFLATDVQLKYFSGSGIINTRFWVNYSDNHEKSLVTMLDIGFQNSRFGCIADYTGHLFKNKGTIKFGLEATLDNTNVDYTSVVQNMNYLGVQNIDIQDKRSGKIQHKPVDLYRGEYGQTNQTYDLTNLALFGQYDHQPFEQLNIVLGARVDKQSEFGTTVNPKLGFALKLLDFKNMTTSFKSNYGKGFRAPTMIDLYSASLNGYGDANIKPEKTDNFDIGLFQRIKNRGYLELSFFKMNVQNLMINDKLGSTGWGQYVLLPTHNGQVDTLAFDKRINRGDYSPQGFELGFKIKLHSQLLLKGAYSYLNPEKFTFQTSEHRYNLNLYFWQQLGTDILLDFEILYNHTGDGYFFDYRIRPYNAFSLTDIGIGIEFKKQYKISFHGRNIVDTTYRLWHHTWQPGRSFAIRFETRY